MTPLIDSKVIKPLPLKLRKMLLQFGQLSGATDTFENALTKPFDVLTAFPPTASFKAVSRPLNLSVVLFQQAVDQYRTEVRKVVRAHFAKVGIESGAVIRLTYPKFRLTLDADVEQVVAKGSVVIKVDSFILTRTINLESVALAVVGNERAANGRFVKATQEFRLAPGYTFEVLKPA